MITQLLIGGRWTEARSGEAEEVHSPFDGSVVGVVPTAGPDDVELALGAAERGAATWRRAPAHERMRILLRAAALADGRTPQIAATLSAENGKTITEVSRANSGSSSRRGPQPGSAGEQGRAAKTPHGL